MQKVSKKAKRKIPKAVWLTALIVLLAIGTVLVIASRRISVIEVPDKQITNFVIFSCGRDDVQEIEITPRSGNAYTLERTEDSYLLKDDPDYPLRENRINAILNCAATIEVQNTVLDTKEENVNLSEFGLNPAKVSMRIRGENGHHCTLSVGILSPEETPLYYAMIEGDSRLFLVNEDVYDTLCYEKRSLHPVYTPKIQGDLIDKITVVQNKTEFAAVYHPSGWQMISPYPYPLDTTRIESLLDSLENIAFAEYIGEADELDLGEYGLDAPRKTLQLDFSASSLTAYDEEGETHLFDIPESTVKIDVGNAYSEVASYLMYEGHVMTGTVLSFAFLENFDYEKLLLQNPINFASNDLSQVTVKIGDRTDIWTVSLVEKILENNEIKTDEYGNYIYEVYAYKNGERIDTTDFLRSYQKLIAITPAGKMEKGFIPDKEARLTVTIVNADQSLSRCVEIYPYNDAFDALAVDGVCLYYISRDWNESDNILVS